MWVGFWSAVVAAAIAVAGWVGRKRIAGRKNVRLVIDPGPTALTLESIAPTKPSENAVMKVTARVLVTNTSNDWPLRILGARLTKDNTHGVVEPDRPDPSILWTYFQREGEIAPKATEAVVCCFFVVIPRNPDGSVTLQPWELRSKILLIDQYGRTHKTKGVIWWT